MTLVDTSAWVEFIRGRKSSVSVRLRELVTSRSVCVTEPIAMEVLAGARNEQHARSLTNMLSWAKVVQVEGLADWEAAATIYRLCRAEGVTPRSQLDCLLAAVAIREDVPILHANRDFDRIARFIPLRVVAV